LRHFRAKVPAPTSWFAAVKSFERATATRYDHGTNMDEASKTKSIMGPLEKSVLTGSGIDIGCGPDPIFPDVRRFDVEDGDANVISQFVSDQFDFVFSSHCLEHMHNPREALLEWWKLVKPGGHIYFIIPDEDLYEQGVFPSRFNDDHKATFTLSKAQSWSPKSVNVLDLARSLPNGRLVSLVLHDHAYDRRLIKFGPQNPFSKMFRFILRANGALKKRIGFKIPLLDFVLQPFTAIDQTLRPNTLAQIQCIVRKEP
jgi:SAM-dependent methyltransferase